MKNDGSITQRELLNWSAKYRSDLNQIRNDLRLKIEKNFDIYIAIDLYDISNYCFPSKANISAASKEALKSNKGKSAYLREQISRAVIFFMFECIYNKPISLLPPHLRECNDFFLKLQTETSKYLSFNLRKDCLSDFDENFLRKLEEANNEGNQDKILDLLNSKSAGLVFLSGRTFERGLDEFNYILRKIITPNPLKWLKDSIEDGNQMVESYCSIIEKLKINGNSDFEALIQDTRNYLNKELQNKRDAEAIFYISELNKKLNPSNKAFMLVSSATHMKRLSKTTTTKLKISIEGLEFDILRDIDFFYTLLIETSKLFQYNMKKADFENLNIRELSESVKNNYIKFDNFLRDSALEANVGQILSLEVRERSYHEIKNINDTINNLDLTFLIDGFIPKEVNNLGYLEKYEMISLYKEELACAIAAIKDTLKRNEHELTKKFFERILQLEKQRLDYFWPIGLGNLPHFKKEESYEVSLFNLPIRLQLIDSQGTNLIKNILDMAIKARLEIRTNFKISKETLNQIYSNLEALSHRADEITGDEKYILWLMIFLSVGRNDLVDYWQAQFYNLVSEKNIQTEISYLYIINFIRKMRKSDIRRKQEYRSILNACQDYIKIYYQNITGIKIESIIDNPNILEYELKKRNIKFANEKRVVKLNSKIIALFGDVSENRKIYIFEDIGTCLKFYAIDIRFVHLEAMIMNRYIKDFGNVRSESIMRRKYELKNIYIPIVKLIETEFEMGIISDYAYLLALDGEDKNYEMNLAEGLKCMKCLEMKSDSPYWNYVKIYILGFIHYRMSILSKGINKKENAVLAQAYFQRAFLEIQPMATYLREYILDLIRKSEKNIQEAIAESEVRHTNV